MAGRFAKRNQNAYLRGALLIALLLALIVTGAILVVRSGRRVREAQDARLSAASSASPSSPADTPAPEESSVPRVSVTIAHQEPLSPPEMPESHVVTLMALGDNLIHNCIYWSAETDDHSYDFSPFYADIAPVVQNCDIACINQETIFVSDHSQISNYPSFGTPAEMADALAGAGFDVVTHATNHCLDKGDTGLRDTIAYWTEHHPEITYLGIHDSEQDAQSIRIAEKNGIRIAMLNFTYGLNSGLHVEPWQVDRFTSFEEVGQDLSEAKSLADFVIVFAHWGEDGVVRVTDYQRNWGQFLADSGADLIIGSHPHLLQPMETLHSADGRDVPVFWSLGNFLSHQLEPQEMLGGMASVEITQDETGTYVTRCELKPTINVILRSETTAWYDYRPMLLEDYTEELAVRHRITGCSPEAMWTLYSQVTGEPIPEPAGSGANDLP